jgi:hypothetical protein
MRENFLVHRVKNSKLESICPRKSESFCFGEILEFRKAKYFHRFKIGIQSALRGKHGGIEIAVRRNIQKLT